MLLWILLSATTLLTVGLRLGADGAALGLLVLLAVATLLHAVMVPAGPSLPGVR